MEEQPILQTVSLFMSSNQIEELNVDVYNFTDCLITTINIKNYCKYTLPQPNALNNFYCVITNKENNIEELIQFRIGRETKRKNVIEKYQKFSSFTFKIIAQLNNKFWRGSVINDIDTQQISIVELARNYLKRLQQKIIKNTIASKLKKSMFIENSKNCKDMNQKRPKQKNTTISWATKSNLQSDSKLKKINHFHLHNIKTINCLQKRRNSNECNSSQLQSSERAEQVRRTQKHNNTIKLESANLNINQTNTSDINNIAKQNTPICNGIKRLMKQAGVKRTSAFKDHSYNGLLYNYTLQQIQHQKKLIGAMKNIKSIFASSTTTTPYRMSVKHDLNRSEINYERLYSVKSKINKKTTKCQL